MSNISSHFYLHAGSPAEDRAMRQLLAHHGVKVPEGSDRVDTETLKQCTSLDFERLEQEAKAGGSRKSLNLDALQQAFGRFGTDNASRSALQARYRAELKADNLAATALSISGDIEKLTTAVYGRKVPSEADFGKLEGRLRSLAKNIGADDWFTEGMSSDLARVHTAIANILLSNSTLGSGARTMVASQWQNVGNEELTRLGKGMDRIGAAMSELLEKADLFRPLKRERKEWEPVSLAELKSDAKAASPDGTIGRFERVEIDAFHTKGFVWVPWKGGEDAPELAHFLQGHDLPSDRQVSKSEIDQKKWNKADASLGPNVFVHADAVIDTPSPEQIKGVADSRNRGGVAPRAELIETLRDKMVHSELGWSSSTFTRTYARARETAGDLFEFMMKTILRNRRGSDVLPPKLEVLVEQLRGRETEHTPSAWWIKRALDSLGAAFKMSAFSGEDKEMITMIDTRFRAAIKDIEQRFEQACAPLSDGELLGALAQMSGNESAAAFTGTSAGQKLGKAVGELQDFIEGDWSKKLRQQIRLQLDDLGYFPHIPGS